MKRTGGSVRPAAADVGASAAAAEGAAFDMYQRSTSTGEGARLLRRLDCLNEHIQAADAHIAKQLEVMGSLKSTGPGAAQAILNALDSARARTVAERDRIRALLDQV